MQEHGLAVIVCTITPFHGFEQNLPGSWTAGKEATRNAVNAFIRNNQNFDGVVDFDSLLSDPSDRTRLRSDLDSGDHLHPNDRGAQLMADFFPLSLLL